MKEAKICQPYSVQLIETEEPEIAGASDVKVQIRYVGVCDDEMPNFRMDDDQFIIPEIANSVGHEFSGTVVAAGEEATRHGFAPGMTVSGLAWDSCGHCYHCRTDRRNHCLQLTEAKSVLAEYVVFSYHQLIPLPDAIPPELGIFCDPVSYCQYVFNKVDFKPMDKVLIFSGSTMAMIMMQLIRKRSSAEITVVEKSEYRRKIALSLGANHVIDPLSENVAANLIRIAGQFGYDVIFEMSKSYQNLRLSPKALARCGTIVFSGSYDIQLNSLANYMEIFLKEATVKSFRLPPSIVSNIDNLLATLDLRSLISKKYSFAEVNEAFLACETEQFEKILIKI